jgi:hypothetical protein
MILTKILSGLPEDLSFWTLLWVTGYLFVIGVAFVCSGGITSNRAQKSVIYYLPRQGYCRWVRRILVRSMVGVIPVTFVVCLLALALGADPSETVTASVVLLLNLMVLSEVQSLLILVKNANLGFVSLWIQQFASLIFSRYLPGNWKLILPGNWGMVGRSSLQSADGFSLPAALAIELAAGIFLWIFGWRLVRRIKRSG